MSTPSKSQRAYDHLRARIDDGSLAPGHRLVLTQIAAELDVSVVPVREAVRRLEAEGLVTFERNVGASVALLDETEYRHTMETLALVEGFATALSAPLLTAEQLDRARAVNERLRRCLPPLDESGGDSEAGSFDAHRFTELNRELHTVLFEPCPNPHVLDLVHRGWQRMERLRDSSFTFVPGRAHESVAEHDHLIDLIDAGAPPRTIEQAARGHRTGTLDAMLDYADAQHATRAPSTGPTLQETP